MIVDCSLKDLKDRASSTIPGMLPSVRDKGFGAPRHLTGARNSRCDCMFVSFGEQAYLLGTNDFRNAPDSGGDHGCPTR